MMRLDRPRVRIGFPAAMTRKMGGIGRDGKPGREPRWRGEGQSSKGQVQKRGMGFAPGLSASMPGTTPTGETTSCSIRSEPSQASPVAISWIFT